MKDNLDLRELVKKERNNIDITGHCRVDYTDPITGKVLERIEGDNHVFVDQFLSTNFQSNNLSGSLLLTNSDLTLDTSLPWIPGRPIGYGSINSSATGIYQGSYRSTDSYTNSIAQTGVTSMYVYDFLTTQIPDTINYVGLTSACYSSVPSTIFTYKWPRNDCSGIYDIERKRLFYNFTCSLSSTAGGDGSLYFYSLDNESGETAVQHDVFELCDSPDLYNSATYGYNYGADAKWGYDYENQYVCLMLTRYYLTREYINSAYYYTWNFTDDIWVFNKDVTEVVNHYQYKWSNEVGTSAGSWQYAYDDAKQFWTGSYFPVYFRLYGDKAIAFSSSPPTYGGTVYTYIYYKYIYDIGTGETTYTSFDTGDSETHPLIGATTILYCYEGYMFGQSVYTSTSARPAQYGFTSTIMGVNPVYDIYNDCVYSYCPICATSNYTSYRLIEKGQTSVYASTWNMKQDSTQSTALMPFALTAYKLPSDAPVRPDGSAVTIAYGLTIKW